MVKFFSLLSLVALILSCSKKDQSIAETKSIIGKINDVSEVISRKAAKGNDLTLESEAGSAIKLNSLGEVFCDLINKNQADSPFELEPYMEVESFRGFKDYLAQLGRSSSCSGTEVVYNKYPLQVIKIEIPDIPSLYLGLNVSKEQRVRNLMFLYGSEDFVFNLDDVVTRDGVNLTTFSIAEDKTPRPTIFLRTPYFGTNPLYYLGEYYTYRALGFNYVVQANRGAFYSGGHFRWLHKENVQDSEDSLNFIVNRPMNNGKVISIGVSYDGFNSLATAITNHSSLVASIACSAPSNAATDSLTGMRSMTFSYLDYIMQREEVEETRFLYEKVEFAIKNDPTIFEDIDLLLFDKKLQDWREYVQSYKNEDNNYFEQRNILKELEKVKVPLFHVAGLKDDQDSRDTILTYQHLQNNLSDEAMKNHYLYLHGGGHDCGGFLNEQVAGKLMSGDLSAIPRVSQYSLQEKRMTSKDRYTGAVDGWRSYPLVFKSADESLNNFNEEAQTLLFDGANLTQAHSIAGAEFTAEKEIVFNGAAYIDLSIYSAVVDTQLMGFAEVIDRDFAQARINNRGYWQTPYAIYLSKEDFRQKKRVRITLPPDIRRIAKGSTIRVFLSPGTARRNFSFDHSLNERVEFYREKLEQDFGYIGILKDEAPRLWIPEEVVDGDREGLQEQPDALVPLN